MKSLTITYEDGLERSRTLREHMAMRVYSGAGVTAVAGKLDMAPSKLSEKLAGGDSSGKPRGMSIDEFERYLETGDLTPIHYLVDKFVVTPEAKHAEAVAQFTKLAEAMAPLAQLLGVKWP